MSSEPLIPKHGGYRKLKSFQIAQLVYDVTVRFCDRFVDAKSRTRDQMVQAARSGVQNIAEGSQASGTSRKMELKLTSVARASLEELRLDYEDYLRQRGLKSWERGDPRRAELVAARAQSADEVAAWVKEIWERERRTKSGLCGRSGQGGQEKTEDAAGQRASGKPAGTLKSTRSVRAAVSSASEESTVSTPSTSSTKSTASTMPTYSEIAANAALVLIAVACGLLDRQLAAQAESFKKNGGFTERLYRVRTEERHAKP